MVSSLKLIKRGYKKKCKCLHMPRRWSREAATTLAFKNFQVKPLVQQLQFSIKHDENIAKQCNL